MNAVPPELAEANAEEGKIGSTDQEQLEQKEAKALKNNMQVFFHQGRARMVRPMSRREFKSWSKVQKHSLSMRRLRERDDNDEADSWKQVSQQAERGKNNSSCQKIQQFKFVSRLSNQYVENRRKVGIGLLVDELESPKRIMSVNQNGFCHKVSSIRQLILQNRARKVIHKQYSPLECMF